MILLHKVPSLLALQGKLGSCLEDQRDGNLLPRREEQNHPGKKCSFSPSFDFLRRKIGSKSSREPTPSILMSRELRN